MNTTSQATTAGAHFWNLRERIGRIRFLAYGFAIGLASWFILIPVAFLGGGAPGQPSLVFIAVAIPAFLFVVVMQVIFVVRRLHDMNTVGWWAFLLLVPVANFIFELVLIFAPGSEAENRFGPKPPPNGLGLYLLAFAPLAIFPLGIIMAIAIPALVGTGGRAAAMEGYLVANNLSVQVQEFQFDNQRLPKLGTDIPAPDLSQSGHVSSVNLDEQGDIRVTLKGSAAIEGKSIVLVPVRDTSTIAGWKCQSDLAESLLPAECRDSSQP